MTDSTRRRLTRDLLGAGALAVGLVLAGAGVASAHVSVSSPQASPGGAGALISFRVPTESASARTVGLKVRLPGGTPIASVLVQPKAGWSVSVTRTKLSTPLKTAFGQVSEVVSEIDWKVSPPAQGIGPGQFDEFTFLAGQLPQAKSLTFKAIQSYSDGSTVSWIEEPAPGSSAEPEHPAPVLNLSGAATSSPGSHGSSGSGSSGSSGSIEPATPSPSSSSSPASPASPVGSASSAGGPNGATSTSEQGEAAAAEHSDAASKATAVTGVVLGGLGVLLGLAAVALALRRRRA